MSAVNFKNQTEYRNLKLNWDIMCLETGIRWKAVNPVGNYREKYEKCYHGEFF